MSSSTKHYLITGTVILTVTGLISRIIGFFYRIFLSHTIGAEGMGIYQLIFPVYTFCFALVVSGVQTGISRCCAAALANENPKKARTYFTAGFFFSLVLSLLAAVFLHRYADSISTSILKENRCAPLLRLIAWSVPMGTIHTCISAWYYAKKQTAIPSISQLLEQSVRVLSSYILYLIFLEKGVQPTPLLAAAGVLAGELSSSIFSGICILFHFQKPEYQGRSVFSRLACGKELVSLSLPLTANRLLLTLLQSAEAILIPGRLKMTGLTASQSLSIYGILTGMALPFILFPSAITNSAATMLLPTIAGEQARGNEQGILNATEKTIKYCLLLGIFALGIFFFFGPAMGSLIFGNEDSGTFIRILSFLCPFLYLTGTLSSILNGLGHTFLCFLQNLIGLSIRIGFVLFGIPRMGITGYLWGILISQLVITVLNVRFVHKKVPFTFPAFEWILKPAAALLVSCGLGLFCFQLLTDQGTLPSLAVLTLSLTFCGICYFVFLFSLGLLHLSSLKQFNT